jgi:uncharacterized membrane protein YdbT with pleckstrin-like domain
MAYVESTLSPGETVLFRSGLHPIYFFRPALLLGIGLLLYSTPRHGGDAISFFMALLVAAAAAMGVVRTINFLTSEFAVSSKRVIMKTGVMRRRMLEMQLKQVESVAVNQSILGRLFQYGAIVVTGAGGTHETFRCIRTPMGLRQAVQGGLAT